MLEAIKGADPSIPVLIRTLPWGVVMRKQARS
jgi:hypothetical protein